jgi:hypothetical protein
MSVDTLSIARELKATKMPAVQAEAIASAIGYTVHENLATKSDLREINSAMREMESRIDTKIEQLRVTMVMWFVGSQIALGALILAALKL